MTAFQYCGHTLTIDHEYTGRDFGNWLGIVLILRCDALDAQIRWERLVLSASMELDAWRGTHNIMTPCAELKKRMAFRGNIFRRIGHCWRIHRLARYIVSGARGSHYWSFMRTINQLPE
jgi:hypothetical protein